MMEKIIKDGMVAVAVHSSYGSGWSTSNHVDCRDARFNSLFLEGKWEEAKELCEELQLGYSGAARGVEIEWVPLKTFFVLNEYDGRESVRELNDFSWIEA
jgi:hypothetical protein